MVPMGTISRLKLEWLEHALGGLHRFAQSRGRAKNLPAHLLVGIEGEDAAFFYLRTKDYTIVARRWSSGDVPGDIDLIAWQGPMLCFVEVKTRSARTITPAEVAVDEHKRATLRRLARRYMSQLPQGSAPAARFDVISVYLGGVSTDDREFEFQHFEAAFGLSEDYRDS
jgi:putative endonuclease